jgi:hypothetical protein
MAAQIRAQKILIFICRTGGDLKQIPLPYKVTSEVGEEVQLRAHGVAGGGMSLTQLQLSIGSIRCAASARQQARRSLGADFLDDVRPFVRRKVIKPGEFIFFRSH